MPNNWRIILGLEVLYWIFEVEFGLHEFLHTYLFKEHERDKGHFIIVNRLNKERIIMELKTNDRGWKDKYFFVENLALNDDGISTSWCIPGKCVSI